VRDRDLLEPPPHSAPSPRLSPPLIRTCPRYRSQGRTTGSYTSRVADKNALKQVKVGDRLDITWTEAVLVSFDNVKPK
jgi:hypothetical protein